ncbi:MAG: type IV pilus modification protein PilV [Psychrobium sp.]
MNTFSKKRGFTLLEVMIAIAILAIGMLGIAGLHMVSMEQNHAAYLRSQAINISQDIIERMRNNPEAVAAGEFNDVKSVGQSMPSSDCLTADEGCSTTQLAKIDIAQWAQMINNVNSDNARQQLPGASATVKAGVNNLFTVRVEWDTKNWQQNESGQTTRQRAKTDYEVQVIIN